MISVSLLFCWLESFFATPPYWQIILYIINLPIITHCFSTVFSKNNTFVNWCILNNCIEYLTISSQLIIFHNNWIYHILCCIYFTGRIISPSIIVKLPPLTSSQTAYDFRSSSILIEKINTLQSNGFHCLKFYHPFSGFTIKICFLITVFLNFWHPILCLVFKHSIDNTD